MPVESAYVHIPFCSYKCDFCDFAAYAGLTDLAPQYCHIVCQEIETRLEKEDQAKAALSSLFYGGGTPGLIEANLIGKIQQKLSEQLGFTDNAEITLETTPHAITYEKAQAWLGLGINRLSVGVQTFNDGELQACGRDHTAMQALEGLDLAKQAGFENISIDLMYGLPTQTKESFLASLRQALDLGFPHLSCYGLTIAEKSPLLIRYPQASESYPSEDDSVFMYEKLTEMTDAYGLVRYEISNFAKPGYASRHNLTYWDGGQYFAFGVSAHRYVNGVRSANFRALKRYMQEFASDESHEAIDEKTRVKETVMLGLRKAEGINFAEFKRAHGIDLLNEHQATITKLADGGFLEADSTCLKLTTKGVLVSNLVISEFI
jgi:oxygen-independent coproporphyrinogen-3 oxidase